MFWYKKYKTFKDLGIGDKFIVVPTNWRESPLLHQKTMNESLCFEPPFKYGKAKQLFFLDIEVNIELDRKVIQVLAH